MKLYALFENEAKLSDAVDDIAAIDQSADIEVMSELNDPVAQTDKSSLATPVAMQVAGTITTPDSATNGASALLPDDIITASSLDRKTKTFLQRRVSEGAAFMAVTSSKQGDKIQRALTQHNGQIWRA